MPVSDGRVVVWFSCGAASACAAYHAVRQHENVRVVYCNTLASEHPDNLRFLSDVEKWIGKPVEIISSTKFANVEEVFAKTKYMSGIAGAPCTRELKKIPRFDYQLPNDLHIFGLTADEGKRIRLFEKNNSEIDMEWNLRDIGITKDDCFKILEAAGIALPVMYSLGFKNNNCIGCVKATSPTYWNRVREHFPEVFERRAQQSRQIGCRLVQIYQHKRIFLDELPPDYVGGAPEKDIECGVICVKESDSE